jgi:solute:Na+ symporter, SSS family
LFAPSLVLSTILGWPLSLTTLLIGTLVIIYLVSGGTKAVSLTQRYQMAIIMGGMVLAGVLAFKLLPEHISFGDTVSIAGELGKFNLVNFNFDLEDRYNIWSGLLAGTFLFLSYFGTDQSQVARYLGGSSETESKLGLIFNGLLKIPMQFMMLCTPKSGKLSTGWSRQYRQTMLHPLPPPKVLCLRCRSRREH